MGDEDDRLPQPVTQRQQVFLQHLPDLSVHRRERLIHEQHIRGRGQRPGQPGSLLHAPGQLGRVLALVPGEADGGDGLGGSPLHLLAVGPGDLQGQGHVAVHVLPGEQPEVLEDDGHPRVGADHRGAADGDAAVVGLGQAGHHPQQGGLATTGRPDDAHELAGLNGEADVLQHDAAGVPLVDTSALDAALTRRLLRG